MKRILFLLPAVALLGGCAGFTSEMLQQDVRIGVGVIRAVTCITTDVFGNPIARTLDALACRASGGTVAQ